MKILIVDDERIVLEETKETVEQVKPEAELICADTCKRALEIAEETRIDVAFLDIQMPEMSGLELAKRLKELNSDINIVFTTAYSQYALDAFSLFASGYLLKPFRKEDVESALENLRNPIQYRPERLVVQCFGNFEVFHEGKPVQFARSKAKELFAYLIDLHGASANTGELCAVLWEDSREADKNRHYLRNLISDVKKALKECGAPEVLRCRRNQFSVDPEKIDCDYYRFLEHDAAAVNSFRGEYMNQYSWAEFSMKNFE